ncbi:MAG: L-threonylcarbamoyladenylate synthase [Oscillospiraceae bacterium]
MKTEVLKVTDDNLIEIAKKAGELLKNGEVVGIPTETVYGLAANALSSDAAAKIFKAKGRPQDNPLIVHISEFNEIYDLVKEVPKNAKKLAENFWPGPLTMIMEKSSLIPIEVSGGLSTVAIRMPSHPVARAIIKASGVPLAAPSANISGSPSPTNAKYVFDDMNGKIPLIVDGGSSKVGVESTVITLVTNPPRVLRPGGITVSQLKSVLGEIAVDEAVLNKLKDGEKASSPGMKYKHYAPKADITIVKGSLSQFLSKVKNDTDFVALCFEGEEDNFDKCVTYGTQDDGNSQANRLFDALRELDEIGAKKVYARFPSGDGVGLAVYNRLLRAAAFKIIE